MGRPLFFLSAMLFLIALLRLSVFVHRDAEFPQNPEAIRIAISLAETGRYADPFYVAATGPTGHLPPVFPFCAAALLRLSGPHWGFALQLAAAACVSLMLALLPWASQRLSMGWKTGVLAATLWLIATPPLYPRFEAALAAVAHLLVTVVAALFAFRPTLGRAAVFGAASALTLLIQPSPLFVLLTFSLLALPAARERLFVAAAVAAALLAPWLIRNRIALGAWVPIRTNMGLELAVSNNDCAQFSFRLNFDSGCMPQRHPNTNLHEALLVRHLGEVDYNRLKLQQALDWIRSHPQAFLELTARRFLAFWIPHESEDIWSTFRQPGFRLHSLMNLLLLPASLAGLFALYHRSPRKSLLLASWLALYPLVYYFVQSDDRYRFPILWVTYLLGSYGLLVLLR